MRLMTNEELDLVSGGDWEDEFADDDGSGTIVRRKAGTKSFSPDKDWGANLAADFRDVMNTIAWCYWGCPEEKYGSTTATIGIRG